MKIRGFDIGERYWWERGADSRGHYLKRITMGLREALERGYFKDRRKKDRRA